MLPTIALVGRPNVGKSTLFNCLTRTRDALVADIPGLTRDRQYGEGTIANKRFVVIDTGGITGEEEGLDELMLNQSQQAILESDIVFFLVDAQDGLTVTDSAIAKRLRQAEKKVYLVINKIDGLNRELVPLDFYQLGFPHLEMIAASHNHGVSALMEKVLRDYPEVSPTSEYTKSIKVAVVGRPNVGKSTLINRMLGEERVVVFDQAGTTRDSIYIPFTRHEQSYTLIDTAGVRRKSRVDEVIEKFSIVKTLQAIEDAHVVVLLFDAQEGIVEQDLHLIGFVLEAGKSLVFAVNKWDGLDSESKQNIKNALHRKLSFVDFCRLHFISALHGTNVGHLYESVDEAYASATKQITTNLATQILTKALEDHQPPLVRGRRIKLRYAHVGGHNPPIIVIHGNQTEQVPVDYRRYLMNYFRQSLHLVGTPIRFEFKTAENPFKGKKNPLTPRQIQKRRRLMKFAKK